METITEAVTESVTLIFLLNDTTFPAVAPMVTKADLMAESVAEPTTLTLIETKCKMERVMLTTPDAATESVR